MERDRIVWKVFFMLFEADVQKEREANRIVVHDERSNRSVIYSQTQTKRFKFVLLKTKLNNLSVRVALDGLPLLFTF